jgi:large subunit ribosomal protein L17
MLKLARTSAHSHAILSNLACSLIEHHRIRTTVAKAKALRPFVEKLITKARRGTPHDRRVVMAKLGNNSKRINKVIEKLFGEIAPLNATRPGGYTRILKLGARMSDAAPMAFIELVEQPVVVQSVPEPTPAKEKGEKKAPAKKAPAKAEAKAEDEKSAEEPAAEASEAKPARKPRAKKTEKKEDEK